MLFSFTLSSILSFNIIQTKTISAVFFDIETIFHTNSMRASGYIGKIDSLRYLSSVGHLPSQEDLFKQLKPVKAKSSEITYNKNLEMPLIFSDWLANKEASAKIKDIISKYFANKNISDVEKRVLYAIVSMMLTPQHLSDTQEVDTKMIKIVEKLRSLNVKRFLVGNWAHIASLKTAFYDVFKLFNGVYVSGDLHLLKPSLEFYQTVLSSAGVTAEQAVWVEAEPKFIAKAKSYGFHVASCIDKNYESVSQTLRQLGMSV